MAVVTTTVFDLENLVGTLSAVAVVTTTVFDLENLVGILCCGRSYDHCV
ncbi:hypothetical protein [Leptospira noguchii]|nr:hypothetical protein [Leptospira noguchii]